MKISGEGKRNGKRKRDEGLNGKKW